MGLPSCAEDATGNNSESLQATLIINNNTNVSTGMQDTVLANGSSTDTSQVTPIITSEY